MAKRLSKATVMPTKKNIGKVSCKTIRILPHAYQKWPIRIFTRTLQNKCNEQLGKNS